MRRLLPFLVLAGLGLGLGGCAVYDDRPAGYYRSGSGYAYGDGYRYRRYPPPRYYRNHYGYRQYGYYRRDPYGW
jgi:hypothetical protein